MSEQSTSGTDRREDGLIILKCHGCKTPTLFKLERCHEADDHEYRAKSFCSRCIRADPLRKIVYSKLEPALVESQQIDPGCHVPDWAVRTGIDR